MPEKTLQSLHKAKNSRKVVFAKLQEPKQM